MCMKHLIPLYALFALCIARSRPDISRLASKNGQSLSLTTAFQTIIPPHFPGGKKAFGEFLNKNLKWPDEIDGQGTVLVGFFVETDGKLTSIHVVRHSVPEFDAEVIRMMRLSPKWVPALRAGKPFKSKYTVPINFILKAN